MCVLRVFDALKRPLMWIPAADAQFARDDIPYATSLTDAEWAVAAPFMLASAKAGRPRLWMSTAETKPASAAEQNQANRP